MPTSVKLYNKTDHNLYFGPSAPTCLFFLGMTAVDSTSTTLDLAQQACEFTCASLQIEGCSCPPSCQPPIITMVAPGAFREVAWTGTNFVHEAMPPVCYMDASCSTTFASCLVEKAATNLPYTLSASLYTQAEGCTGACVDCTPGGLGTCTIQGATNVGGTEVVGTASWSGASKVEIDFN